jgi:hypothetical protein
MEARSLGSAVVGWLGLGLFGLFVVFGGLRFGSALSFLASLPQLGVPLTGAVHPLLPLCRPARLPLSHMRVSVVPALSFFRLGVGFGFWLFLVVLVLGCLSWLVAGGRPDTWIFYLTAVSRGLPRALVDASTCNFGKDLSVSLLVCFALAGLLSVLVVLPSATS